MASTTERQRVTLVPRPRRVLPPLRRTLQPEGRAAARADAHRGRHRLQVAPTPPDGVRGTEGGTQSGTRAGAAGPRSAVHRQHRRVGLRYRCRAATGLWSRVAADRIHVAQDVGRGDALPDARQRDAGHRQHAGRVAYLPPGPPAIHHSYHDRPQLAAVLHDAAVAVRTTVPLAGQVG